MKKIEETSIKKHSFSLCQMTEKGRGSLMGGTQSNQKLSNERWPIEI